MGLLRPDVTSGLAMTIAKADRSTMETIETIKELLYPVLEQYGAELMEVSLHNSPGRPLLRILIDKKDGSQHITVDECSAINRELGDMLDKAENVKEPYLLEVSSPGLDRPLKTKKDFEKIIGGQISLTAKTPDGTLKTYQVKLDSVDDKGINIKNKDGRTSNIPYEDIHVATLQIKF